MSNDASEIVVGANGRVLVADADALGSGDFPVDVITSGSGVLDPSLWTEVGFVSENGVTFTDGKTIADIPAWQAFYPVRKIVTDKMTKVEFVMRQWNTETIRFAFGGGDVDLNGGVATYTPPAPGDLDNRAMIVEWEDGADTYRLVLPRGIVTGDVAAQVVRTAASDLPVSFEVSPAGLPVEGDLSTQPWYILTDADQFSAGTLSMIDLDAIRAQRLGTKRKGPSVKYGGKTYNLAAEMPFEVLEAFAALTDDATAGSAIANVARVLLGKHYEAFRDMSVDDLNALVEGVMAEYGVTNPLPSSAS